MRTDEELPPDAVYIRDFLSNEAALKLQANIDIEPWRHDLKRRVQHYGYRYDYRSRRASPEDYIGDLPDWLKEPASRLRSEGYFTHLPQQVIVNEYLPGQGIAPHVDCVPCFGEKIASISLGSICEMQFRDPRSDRQRKLLLEPKSLLVLAGRARYEWTHGIAARKSDIVDNQRILRKRRVSLTFRTMLIQ